MSHFTGLDYATRIRQSPCFLKLIRRIFKAGHHTMACFFAELKSIISRCHGKLFLVLRNEFFQAKDF